MPWSQPLTETCIGSGSITPDEYAMSELAIRVENLGKRYRIGERREKYGTLKDALTHALGAPLRAWRDGASRKSKTEIWALQDVSFDVRRGDVLAVIGRNGAGKSTLLKLLSRVVRPTAGRAVIHGRVGSLLEVGTGFHPELTGRENIYLNGAILGMTRTEIERRFDEIVAFAEMERFLDTPVKRYSSGMYMRLAFAVAAHLEPEILLIDEVLAVGDAGFQKKCLGKMDEVAKEGRTVLFVSHNMASIQRLCHSAVLLDGGRMAACGAVSDVIQRYLKGVAPPVQQWERSRPPTTEIYFQRVYLTDEAGATIDHVTTSGQVRVVMEYVVQRRCRNLQVIVDLLDGNGDVIFTSTPQDVGLELPEQAGHYSAVVALPPHILLPKLYGIRTHLWVPWDGVVDTVDSLRFSVHEMASLSNETREGRFGQLLIPCNWSISQTQ
jgi:lipopolysaccharide transport system ATP-binding protein